MACISKRRGRWVLDFYDQHGKRRWKTLPEGATKGQAKEELRAIEDMLSKGVYLPHAKIPAFSEVACDWLEHKKLKLRETTWEVYAAMSGIIFPIWIISKSTALPSPRWRNSSPAGRSRK